MGEKVQSLYIWRQRIHLLADNAGARTVSREQHDSAFKNIYYDSPVETFTPFWRMSKHLVLEVPEKKTVISFSFQRMNAGSDNIDAYLSPMLLASYDWETPTRCALREPNRKEPPFSGPFHISTNLHPSSVTPLFYGAPIFLPLLWYIPSIINILPVVMGYIKSSQLSRELCPWQKETKISLSPLVFSQLKINNKLLSLPLPHTRYKTESYIQWANSMAYLHLT